MLLNRMSKNVLRLLAYIYVPVIFLALGLGVVALVLSPFYSVGQAAATLLFRYGDATGQIIENATFMEPNQEELKQITNELVNEDNAIDIQNITWPAYGDQYGILRCEEIGLDTVVFWGDGNEQLREGPGTFMGSSLPGMDETILIAGHNTMEFTVLQHIEKGDKVTFTVAYGQYEYEITDIRYLQHDDPTAFDLDKKEEELVLYTCYPFTQLGFTTERCFVYAKRVAGPDVVRKEVDGLG